MIHQNTREKKEYYTSITLEHVWIALGLNFCRQNIVDIYVQYLHIFKNFKMFDFLLAYLYLLVGKHFFQCTAQKNALLGYTILHKASFGFVKCFIPE